MHEWKAIIALGTHFTAVTWRPFNQVLLSNRPQIGKWKSTVTALEIKNYPKSLWNHYSITKLHIFCHFNLYTFKNLDFQKNRLICVFQFRKFDFKTLSFQYESTYWLEIKSLSMLKSFVRKKGPKVIVVVILKLHFEFKTNPIVVWL